mmetsp:Transcript_10342/g.16926  ORF Transcript_10342/g.16926 Transcript_10342/m.16926 type:complete len:105 (-) Transcript_10342:323-637(-)
MKETRVVRAFKKKITEDTVGAAKQPKGKQAIDLTGDEKSSQLMVEHKLSESVTLDLEMRTALSLHESLITGYRSLGREDKILEAQEKWVQKLEEYFNKKNASNP